MKTCNLCGQSFDESDPLWNVRKARHEQRHKRITLSKNQILGDVSWQ